MKEQKKKKKRWSMIILPSNTLGKGMNPIIPPPAMDK